MDNLQQLMVGKTIQSTEWVGHNQRFNEEPEGYGNFRIIFTDGTSVVVCYSCMGGVYLSDRDC